MAPADLLPFLLLGLGLTAPVAALGHGFDDIQAARRAVGRIREVLAVPPLPEPAHPVAPQGHRVELRGVRFGYEAEGEAGREVLRGIDLVLEPGTTTAIVGPSGSGKSTLVQLLPRFYDPTHGSVTLGGIDLRELGFRALDDSLRDVQRASRRSTLSGLPGVVGSALAVQAAFTVVLTLGAYLALGGALGAAEVLALLVLAARCADPLLP